MDEHPVVKQAREQLHRMEMERGFAELERQVKEISAIDPSIRSMDDLRTLPNKAVIDRLVIERGYSLMDAYKLANYDTLVEKRTAAAKQAAINAANGKGHLTQTQSGAAGAAVTIPPEILADYKQFDYTAKEAAEHYASMQKGR